MHDRKTGSDNAELTIDVLRQTLPRRRAATTGKAWLPIVESRIQQTIRDDGEGIT